jgi:hypothetical protein
MARLIALEFDLLYRYDLTPSGIIVPVELVLADRRIVLPARLDTGSSDCLFDRSFAELLGIGVESGYQRTYRTVAGSFSAFGHELALRTQGMNGARWCFSMQHRIRKRTSWAVAAGWTVCAWVWITTNKLSTWRPLAVEAKSPPLFAA